MTAPAPAPEVWLRGPVPGVPPELQPVAHALLQALEDAERLTAGLGSGALWTTPGGAASVGFHLRHMTGSLDRLVTYASGEALSEEQRAALAAEKEPAPGVGAEALLAGLRDAVERALARLRETDPRSLDDDRPVGRAGFPSTVRGLLHHAGEHTARHAGQISTTVRIVTGEAGSEPAGVRPARAPGTGRIHRIAPDEIPLMEELLTVFGEAFGDVESYGAHRPGADYLRRLLGGDTFIALAAREDGEVVGGIAAYELRKFEQERSEIYIYDLAVAERHRRKGIATELISELCAIARARGAWVVYVQADHVDAPAVALYTRLGTREDVLHFDIPVETGED
jgi:aminoglycoside 3-N-acetyltransferase I